MIVNRDVDGYTKHQALPKEHATAGSIQLDSFLTNECTK